MDLLERVAKLRAMTCSRGATQGEADAAALRLGRMLQEDASLVISLSPRREEPRREKPREQPFWGERQSEVGVRLRGVVVHVTDKAFLFSLEQGKEVWIPKSQIIKGNWHEWKAGEERECYVSLWWARKQGLSS